MLEAVGGLPRPTFAPAPAQPAREGKGDLECSARVGEVERVPMHAGERGSPQVHGRGTGKQPT